VLKGLYVLEVIWVKVYKGWGLNLIGEITIRFDRDYMGYLLKCLRALYIMLFTIYRLKV
jgi:hypothetical protein